jgi:hypothetical protein
MKRFYIVHRDRPRDALRVCRNSRSANFIASLCEDYLVTEGPIDRIINMTVDLTPAEQVFGRLS